MGSDFARFWDLDCAVLLVQAVVGEVSVWPVGVVVAFGDLPELATYEAGIGSMVSIYTLHGVGSKNGY